MPKTIGLATLVCLWLLVACTPTAPTAPPGGATPGAGTTSTPTPTPEPALVEQMVVAVQRGPLCANFSGLAPSPTRLPLNGGDCLQTDPQGLGYVYLRNNCATLAVYWDSAVKMSEVNVLPISTSILSGTELVSLKCGSIQVSLGGNPPEAMVQTSGTVFFTAYDAQQHLTLLWTLVGQATVTNVNADGSNGRTQPVSQGTFSVVQNRQAPVEPRPVSEMGAVIAKMGLETQYNDVVQTVTQRGFGPAAPGPITIATVAPPTPTPTVPPPADTVNHPTRLALYPLNHTVWVIDHGDGTLSEWSAEKRLSVLKPTPALADPADIAIWQAKGLAYVTDRKAGTVTEIDLDKHASRLFAKTDALLTEIAVDEETGDLYILGGDNVIRIDRDTRKPQLLKSATGGTPLRIVYSAAAHQLWVLSCCTPEVDSGKPYAAVTPLFSGGKFGDAVFVPIENIKDSPFGFALAPDGISGYITLPGLKRILTWTASGPGPASNLDFSPYAIQSLGRCLGVIDAANSRVVLLEPKTLEPIGNPWVIGAQETHLETASDLVYDPQTDIFYVAEYADGKIGAAANPCA
jgi:hypothetical protein